MFKWLPTRLFPCRYVEDILYKSSLLQWFALVVLLTKAGLGSAYIPLLWALAGTLACEFFHVDTVARVVLERRCMAHGLSMIQVWVAHTACFCGR